MQLSGFFNVEPQGQALLQVGELTLALVLSALIGSASSAAASSSCSETWCAA